MTIKTRKMNVLISNEATGEEIYRKDNFEVPEFWSDRAATIAANKYAMDNETSVLVIIDRIVQQITTWGMDQGYFGTGPERENYANKFIDRLKEILIYQRASFNSPVWFNIGVPENPNQASACFILPVEDNMKDILQHGVREGMIFKGGSGAGVNISKLRADGELLSNKGRSSGPISFLKAWDAIAGSVKSGGRTRRSAKLVCMDADHPDIMEFIHCKYKEEAKAKALMAAGYTPETAYNTVCFQNANHSIRVTSNFMEKALKDEFYTLKNRKDKTAVKSLSAQKVLRTVAEVAWATGDPGIQFHDRANNDNPVPSLGQIRATNPCAEFSAIDNSACNLASLNLVKYLIMSTSKIKKFNWEMFEDDIGTLITAMDILIEAADYPTPEIKDITIATRPLGLGFTNLGALLMLFDLPYNSLDARKLAATITLKMTSSAYQTSILLAHNLGSYKAFEADKDRAADIALRLTKDPNIKANILGDSGLRNSQLTLLAPTGTISFLMDCDSTGIEPLFAIEATKTLSGGGQMTLKSDIVRLVLEKYNIDPNTKQDLWPPDVKEILKTANEIHWKDHIKMMAACQPHLNGAISKTINMPTSCTVEDVLEAYKTAYLSGLKSITIYRDGSKTMQPLRATVEENNEEEDNEIKWSPVRRKLSGTRPSITHKFNIAGYEGFIISGVYEDGTLGEIFLKVQKQGSTINGLMDAFAIVTSLALQYGVPLEVMREKLTQTRFDPQGFTQNPDIQICTSIMDYIFRWLSLEFGDEEMDENNKEQITLQSIMPSVSEKIIDASGPPCTSCGSLTTQSGTCYVCLTCGTTNGCG